MAVSSTEMALEAIGGNQVTQGGGVDREYKVSENGALGDLYGKRMMIE